MFGRMVGRGGRMFGTSGEMLGMSGSMLGRGYKMHAAHASKKKCSAWSPKKSFSIDPRSILDLFGPTCSQQTPNWTQNGLERHAA